MPAYVIDFSVSGEIKPDASLRNRAQRELLTSWLLRRRLNYCAYHELMICNYCFRNNAVFFLYIVFTLGREIREPSGNANKEVGESDVISNKIFIEH